MTLGVLILRLAVGGTMAAHGVQKLAPPRFGGAGLETTARLLDSLGFRPARAHAWLLALAELAGGVALAAGFVTPIAAATVIGVTVAAIATVHLPHGFFAQNGGFELPLVLGLGAWATALTGPGAWSLDHALGWDLSSDTWAAVALILGVAVALVVSAARRVPQPRVIRRRAAHA